MTKTRSPIDRGVLGTRKLLDRLTGRVTMYRLVTLLLSVVAGAAILLAAVGALPWTPVDLIASLAVGIAATVVSGRIAALILRSRPHL